MTTGEARELLWPKFANVPDDEIDNLVSIYRAVARLFIKNAVTNKKSSIERTP